MSDAFEFNAAASSPIEFDVFTRLVFAIQEEDKYWKELEVWEQAGRIGAGPEGEVPDPVRDVMVTLHEYEGHPMPQVSRLTESAYRYVEALEQEKQ